MDDHAPSMLKPTLIGGGLFGLVGAIPYLGALNCLCCSLIIGGGFLAAYLYSRECAGQGVAFRPGSGAVVGLIAALFHAIANTAVWRVVATLMPQDPDQIVEQLEQAGMPAEYIDIATNVFDMLSGFVGVIIYFFVILLIGAVFSTIGGLIGGAVFKVEPAPPAPPVATEPPAPPVPPLPPAGGPVD